MKINLFQYADYGRVVVQPGADISMAQDMSVALLTLLRTQILQRISWKQMAVAGMHADDSRFHGFMDNQWIFARQDCVGRIKIDTKPG